MHRDGWESCVVAATGPSLTPDLAERCRGRRVIAVNDAWRLLPFADVLYACDRQWWDVSGPAVEQFSGERWSSQAMFLHIDDDKVASGHATKYALNLVAARDAEGFCCVPGRIHYGNNSGFQGVNLAIQFGAKLIELIGFDMHRAGGKEHFFGDHPAPLHNGSDFGSFIHSFKLAAKTLPTDIEIINCTPGSALRCFPFGTLNEVDHDRYRRTG